MASTLRRGGLGLALIILIVVSLSFEAITVADARTPYKRERQLVTDCDSPIQEEIPGCGGGSGSGSGRSSRQKPRPRPRQRRGRAPAGSSRCRNSCCGRDKLGQCVCC